jgi:drug/metabolite transporter (DMT)-like permease
MRPPASPAAAPAPAAGPLGVKPILLMLASCVFFAWMALTVGAANVRAPELHVATASLFRAATNLIAVALLGRFDRRTLLGDGRLALWTRGIWGSASLLCFFGALSLLDIGQSAFLNYTSAFWVAALGPIVLKERTPPLVWLAVGGSTVGVLLLSEPRAGDGLGRALGLASGLFADGHGELLGLNEQMIRLREKAIPWAGAAVRLELRPLQHRQIPGFFLLVFGVWVCAVHQVAPFSIKKLIMKLLAQ